MDVSLHIVYKGEVGRQLTAAKTRNRELIVQTANKVTQEAYERAETVGEIDKFLGDVQKEEAKRLERVLKAMIPELN